MHRDSSLLVLVFALAVICLPAVFMRSAVAQIGAPLPGLKQTEADFFNNGQIQFLRVWGMTEGVGPVLTDGSCQRCHNTPALGGSSNRLLRFFGKSNPDGTFDPLDGTGPSGLNEGGVLLQTRSNKGFA